MPHPMNIADFPLTIRTVSHHTLPSLPPGFILLVIADLLFSLEALGFVAPVFFCCCFDLFFWFEMQIISLAFYFDFLFIREMYLCKSTHTYTILVSLGRLVKGRRQTSVASSKLLSKIAG